MRLMRLLIFLIAPVLLGVANQAANAQGQAAPSSATTAQDLASFVEQERQLLAPFHLIPIVVPRGERVGDNFDRKTSTLLAGADDCFPRLKIRKEPGQLPSITTFSERGLAAALGASGVLNVEGGTTIKRVYVLSFKDVEVQTASVVQLRKAIPRKSAQECEVVRPYLQALGSSKPVASSLKISIRGLKIPPRRVATLATENTQAQLPVVIGTIFYARRVLRVALSENLDAQAKLSWGQSFLQSFGLNSSFRLSADGGSVNSNAVEFVGEAVIPVAYAPAFDTETKVAEGGKTTMQIAEITPREIVVNVAVTEALLNKNNLFAGASRDFPLYLKYFDNDDDHMLAESAHVPRGFLLGTPPDLGPS
jgi:hypothetical protein